MRFQIGVKGAEAIADCLLYNSTISTLDLRANSLGDDVCIWIKYYMISGICEVIVSEEWAFMCVVGFVINVLNSESVPIFSRPISGS